MKLIRSFPQDDASSFNINLVFWTISRNERTVKSERIFGDILLGFIFAINDGEDGFNNHYAIVRHDQAIRDKTKMSSV